MEGEGVGNTGQSKISNDLSVRWEREIPPGWRGRRTDGDGQGAQQTRAIRQRTRPSGTRLRMLQLSGRRPVLCMEFSLDRFYMLCQLGTESFPYLCGFCTF